MKALHILPVLLFIGTFTSRAQSVVFVCDNTGIIGYSWAGSTSGKDQASLEYMAKEACIKDGGTNCKFRDYINLNGCYVAYVVGYDDQYIYSDFSTSYISADDAMSTLENNLMNGSGGPFSGYPPNARVYWWYIPE